MVCPLTHLLLVYDMLLPVCCVLLLPVCCCCQYAAAAAAGMLLLSVCCCYQCAVALIFSFTPTVLQCTGLEIADTILVSLPAKPFGLMVLVLMCVVQFAILFDLSFELESKLLWLLSTVSMPYLSSNSLLLLSQCAFSHSFSLSTLCGGTYLLLHTHTLTITCT